MAREQTMIPFGAQEHKPDRKGTVIYYDDFQDVKDEDLQAAVDFMNERKFGRLIFYPLHEETVRRMNPSKVVEPLYKRQHRLVDFIDRSPDIRRLEIEAWESKRKKYTPIEAALRHMTTKYKAPHFIYMSPQYSHLFASYPSFDEWISKVRLVVSQQPSSIHPKLQKYANRFDTI